MKNGEGLVSFIMRVTSGGREVDAKMTQGGGDQLSSFEHAYAWSLDRLYRLNLR